MAKKVRERISIRNFGPIRELDLQLKPFIVLIGESGSGKSVFMKLLATCRWIHKKIAFASIVAHIQPSNKSRNAQKFYRELYQQQIKEININTLIKNGGLSDFIDKDGRTEIVYRVDNFEIKIHNKNENKLTLEMPKNFHIELEEIVLKKLSFISDDRFTVPMMMQGAHFGFIPFHLERTYRDFVDVLKNAGGKNLSTNTLGLHITQEKRNGLVNFFIEKDGVKVPFHNASAGHKSVAIIETISKYYTLEYDLSSSVNRFFVSHFKNINDFNYVLDIALDIKRKIENGLREYKKEVDLFIEEPEISLFPQAQYDLISYLTMLFLSPKKNHLRYVFSTHSPYILSALNCFLKASILAKEKPYLVEDIANIIPKNNWLHTDSLSVFLIENENIKSIMNAETGLIAAEKIDGVSECIGSIFDQLIDLEYRDQ